MTAAPRSKKLRGMVEQFGGNFQSCDDGGSQTSSDALLGLRVISPAISPRNVCANRIRVSCSRRFRKHVDSSPAAMFGSCQHLNL